MCDASQDVLENLLKIILVGDCGVGKSNVLSRYTKDTFTETDNRSIGVDFCTKTVDIGGFKANIQVWDIAGHERFRPIIFSYFRMAHGVMIIYDLTDKDSFDNVKYWMETTDQYCRENVSKLLVGNKNDLTLKKVIDSRKAEEFAVQVGMPFMETSSKKGTGIKKAFRTLVQEIRNRLPSPVKTEGDG